MWYVQHRHANHYFYGYRHAYCDGHRYTTYGYADEYSYIRRLYFHRYTHRDQRSCYFYTNPNGHENGNSDSVPD
jgi:hypothetical protein